MAFTHAKDTYVSLNAVDLSAFTNNTEYEESADEHDVTTYGKNSHVFAGGLKGGTATISGVHDNGPNGPRKVIKPLVGNVVPLVHRAEGTGTGKPQDTVNALVKSYKESAPVADMRMWTAELTFSDDVVSTNQA
ncbi:hypothetical protein LWC34_38860 [Kibdelosporangium philippinense]|uniref:Phage tail protein n=1 Tax=Kibdelosporangium philippinense TaxID=211113 RepID=A0ABS8ZLS0_9PSEU|nr:hypothetical protein [Kibdelosporangium philippinense]MCE7008731.1 hypothetical protein [Kibdelosporangium philippinense]